MCIRDRTKTMLKNRKNKALFFKNTEEEIKNSYPKEVYDAYKNNDTYAVLDEMCIRDRADSRW